MFPEKKIAWLWFQMAFFKIFCTRKYETIYNQVEYILFPIFTALLREKSTDENNLQLELTSPRQKKTGFRKGEDRELIATVRT